MRTNIVIDDEMMRNAMEVSGIRTKKGVVDAALREFIANRTRKDLNDLRGKIRFTDGDEREYKRLREYLDTLVIYYLPEDRETYEKAARLFSIYAAEALPLEGRSICSSPS